MTVLRMAKYTGRRQPGVWMALLAGAHGFFIIASTLFGELVSVRAARHAPAGGAAIDIPLLSGFALLYLSLLLWRLKRNAWVCATALYIFLLGFNIDAATDEFHRGGMRHALIVLLSAFMLVMLWFSRRAFVVKSDMRTFASSLRIALLLLATAFLYGTCGFLLMDRVDFRQRISLFPAMHYTVDQFALTTAPLHAYTRRAALFQGSLTTASVAALGFTAISLFQPLRSRYIHQKERLDLAERLIRAHPHDSEDYFKLWPHDKTYFFSADNRAGVAFRVQHGIALVVGEPFGVPAAMDALLAEFEELCFANDWRPAFIHIADARRDFFEARGYKLQPIGKEAVVDLEAYTQHIAATKHFREIARRFTRQGYHVELLQPPHHRALLSRLKVISDEWLERPGRVERRFMMGYFQEAYMQRCTVAVVRDAAGTIQAFMNLVPSPLPEEANYDLLRAGAHAPGNTNDFMLLEVMRQLHQAGTVKRLNMGLCPLAGLEHALPTLVNRTLSFVYANGDRLYSFHGLYRFKAKYAPVWGDRYIAYKGNAAEFTRVMAALNRAMKM